MSRKDFALFIVTIVVAAILIGGGVWYYRMKNYIEPPASPSPLVAKKATSATQQESALSTTTTSSAIDISGWKTYPNEKYGFEVKYPNDWKFQQFIETGFRLENQTGNQIEVYVIDIPLSFGDNCSKPRSITIAAKPVFTLTCTLGGTYPGAGLTNSHAGDQLTYTDYTEIKMSDKTSLVLTESFTDVSKMFVDPTFHQMLSTLNLQSKIEGNTTSSYGLAETCKDGKLDHIDVFLGDSIVQTLDFTDDYSRTNTPLPYAFGTCPKPWLQDINFDGLLDIIVQIRQNTYHYWLRQSSETNTFHCVTYILPECVFFSDTPLVIDPKAKTITAHNPDLQIYTVYQARLVRIETRHWSENNIEGDVTEYVPLDGTLPVKIGETKTIHDAISGAKIITKSPDLLSSTITVQPATTSTTYEFYASGTVADAQWRGSRLYVSTSYGRILEYTTLSNEVRDLSLTPSIFDSNFSDVAQVQEFSVSPQGSFIAINNSIQNGYFNGDLVIIDLRSNEQKDFPVAKLFSKDIDISAWLGGGDGFVLGSSQNLDGCGENPTWSKDESYISGKVCFYATLRMSFGPQAVDASNFKIHTGTWTVESSKSDTL